MALPLAYSDLRHLAGRAYGAGDYVGEAQRGGDQAKRQLVITQLANEAARATPEARNRLIASLEREAQVRPTKRETADEAEVHAFELRMAAGMYDLIAAIRTAVEKVEQGPNATYEIR